MLRRELGRGNALSKCANRDGLCSFDKDSWVHSQARSLPRVRLAEHPVILAVDYLQHSVPVHSLDRRQSVSRELSHLCSDVRPGHHFLRQRNAQDGFHKGPEHISVMGCSRNKSRHDRVRRRRWRAIEQRVDFSDPRPVGADLVPIERGHLALGLRVVGSRESRGIVDMPRTTLRSTCAWIRPTLSPRPPRGWCMPMRRRRLRNR